MALDSRVILHTGLDCRLTNSIISSIGGWAELDIILIVALKIRCCGAVQLEIQHFVAAKVRHRTIRKRNAVVIAINYLTLSGVAGK